MAPSPRDKTFKTWLYTYHLPQSWPEPPADWRPPPGWKPDPHWATPRGFRWRRVRRARLLFLAATAIVSAVTATFCAVNIIFNPAFLPDPTDPVNFNNYVFKNNLAYKAQVRQCQDLGCTTLDPNLDWMTLSPGEQTDTVRLDWHEAYRFVVQPTSKVESRQCILLRATDSRNPEVEIIALSSATNC